MRDMFDPDYDFVGCVVHRGTWECMVCARRLAFMRRCGGRREAFGLQDPDPDTNGCLHFVETKIV